MMTYLYGPVATVALYTKQFFRRTPASQGLTIGDPISEDAAAVNRRALVAHPFTPDQIAYAREVIAGNGHTALITISSTFPTDWRWPVASPLLVTPV